MLKVLTFSNFSENSLVIAYSVNIEKIMIIIIFTLIRWLVSKTTKMLSPSALVKSIVGFRFSGSIIFAPSLFNIDIFEAALSQQIFVTTTPVSFNSFTANSTRLDKSKYSIFVKNEQF